MAITRDRGDVAMALRHARTLAGLYPNDVPLRLLIQKLERRQPR